MSGCHVPNETLALCKHGTPVKFGCFLCSPSYSSIKIKDLQNLIFEGAQTHASILRCEAKIKELEKSIQEMRGLSLHPKKPHKCPVCDGNGSWYGQEVGKNCFPCQGKGIVWG